MIWTPLSRRASHLAPALRGRELKALFLDAGEDMVRLCFSDNSAVAINLQTRAVNSIRVKEYPVWISLPGWVRIADVTEDASQIVLVVSGTIYTARISLRLVRERWRIVFSGGRIF